MENLLFSQDENTKRFSNLNFDDFINLLKELGFKLEQIEDTYIISHESKNCSINVELNSIAYVIKTLYKEEQKTFEGAINFLTMYYIYNLLTGITRFPWVYISAIFGVEGENYPLSIYNERIIFGIVEWGYLLKYILKLESWDGEIVELDYKEADISVVIEQTGTPFLLFSVNKGNTFNLELTFSLYDWLLDIKEEFSWILHDRITYKLKDIPNEAPPYLEFFQKVFNAYGVDVELKDIYKNIIDLPIRNPYILKSDFYMNHLGVVVRIYTHTRPDRPFKIKLPYRANIEYELDVFNKFLFTLLKNPVMFYFSTLLPQLSYIDNIYMGLFTNSDFLDESKQTE